MVPRLATLLCSIYAIADARVRQKPMPHMLRSSATGLHNFSANSPCGPAFEEETENNVNISSNWQDATRLQDGNARNLKFFLHSHDAFDLTHIVKCYFRYLGTENELDLHLFPNDAEHSGDVPLIKLMTVHKDRTWNEDEADIHVVGAPLETAWLASRNTNCTNDTVLRQRETEMRDALRELKSFQEAPQKFVFIDSDWRVKGALGDDLMGVVQRKSVLAGGDTAFTAHAHRHIIIPYLANFKLDKAAHTFTSYAMTAPSEASVDIGLLIERRRLERPVSFHVGMDAPRDTSITFNGNFRNARETIVDITRGIANTSVQEAFFRDFSLDEMANITMATADTMLHSKLCLVPNGDTATSRRLFDALAAGCVPVYLGGFYGIINNLPFKNTIRWGDIVIFAGSLGCNAHNVPEAKTWLEGLLAETPETFFKIERMRRLGQAVYAKYLSYSSKDMVGAFLGQFDESGNTV